MACSADSAFQERRFLLIALNGSVPEVEQARVTKIVLAWKGSGIGHDIETDCALCNFQKLGILFLFRRSRVHSLNVVENKENRKP